MSTKITMADVERRLNTIKNAAGDDEKAHNLEDKLRRDVLRCIADGTWDLHESPLELARAALSTALIEFGRYTA